MNNISFPCCAKVLPLTYDESLSYYEQLCKLTGKMNEIVEFMNGEIDTTIQNYLDEHFNDLMVNATYDATSEMIILKRK